MALEVVVLSLVGLVCARCLVVETLDLRRQKSVQAEGGAFLIRERGAFVQTLAVQELHARETSACCVVISSPPSSLIHRNPSTFGCHPNPGRDHRSPMFVRPSIAAHSCGPSGSSGCFRSQSGRRLATAVGRCAPDRVAVDARHGREHVRPATTTKMKVTMASTRKDSSRMANAGVDTGANMLGSAQFPPRRTRAHPAIEVTRTARRPEIETTATARRKLSLLRACSEGETATHVPRVGRFSARTGHRRQRAPSRRGLEACRVLEGFRGSDPAVPGRSERWGAWGAISGPPCHETSRSARWMTERTPSPRPPPTRPRFTLPDLTSPTAKMPGLLVSSRSGRRTSGHPAFWRSSGGGRFLS